MSKPSRVWVDLETYSRVDLRKATPYRYTEDPEFLILMGSYSLDPDDSVHDLIGQDALMDTLGEYIEDPEVIKVAHNAPFERICFSAALGMGVGNYLSPRAFHDTQAIAGIQGLPQKLETLAHVVGGEKKDTAGTHLINWFCKPDPRTGRRRLPEDHPEKWEAFVRYCNQDVVTLKDVDAYLGDFPTDTEREVYFTDQLINDRGLRIDVRQARAAMEAADLNRMEQELELSGITGLAKPGNPVTLRSWFGEQGVRMPDMKAETVEAKLDKLIERDETESPRYRALELRQELALTAAKKYDAALYAVSPDERLRGAFRYFGAHTGRWSGRGAQPHNLPRHTFDNDADVELALMDLMAGERISADELKKLVRPLFIVDGAVVDYSSIEARYISWLGWEEWALEAFREGRDIYVETAERMGGLSRAQGKIAVLALGFGGGVNSLKVMATTGFYYDPSSGEIVDDPADGIPMTDEHIREKLVMPWRRANPNIVKLWYNLEEAFGNGTGRVGKFLSVSEDEDRLGRLIKINLPSGRAIHYHGVKWERFPVFDKRTGKRSIKEGWRYANPKDPFNRNMRINTYGGRLAENVTQAGARDLLAEGLVRMERAGYEPVGHVHDEALVQHASHETVAALMTSRPSWARGLPVDGEGFNCYRYKKG